MVTEKRVKGATGHNPLLAMVHAPKAAAAIADRQAQASKPAPEMSPSRASRAVQAARACRDEKDEGLASDKAESVGRIKRRPSILGNDDNAHASLSVEFFDSESMETHEEGGFHNVDLILKCGKTFVRISTEFVPPGYEAPVAEPCMEVPMSVMRGSSIKILNGLISHEEARSSGLLLKLEFQTRVVSRTKVGDPSSRVQKTILLAMTGGRVLNPLRRIIYLSHHWHGPGLPDNSAGSKLRLIKGALNDDDFVWMDVWSLPRSQVEAATRSMQAYIFYASQLLVVAPSREDFEQLLGSAWCQAEFFAAMCPVVRRETVMSAGSSWSLVTRCLRHACKADVLIGNTRDQWHGGDDLELFALDPKELRDPFSCKIVNRDELPMLQCVVEQVQKSLLAAKPLIEPSREVAISGIKESMIDGMLSILSH